MSSDFKLFYPVTPLSVIPVCFNRGPRTCGSIKPVAEQDEKGATQDNMDTHEKIIWKDNMDTHEKIIWKDNMDTHVKGEIKTIT